MFSRVGYIGCRPSRSGLIGGYEFKVRTPSVACKVVFILEGKDAGTGCAGWGLTALTQDPVSTLFTQYSLHTTREAMFSRSLLFGSHVFKVKVD